MNKKSAILLLLAVSGEAAIKFDPEVIQYGYAGDCMDHKNFNTEFGHVVVGCNENCLDVKEQWKNSP